MSVSVFSIYREDCQQVDIQCLMHVDKVGWIYLYVYLCIHIYIYIIHRYTLVLGRNQHGTLKSIDMGGYNIVKKIIMYFLALTYF